MKKTLKIFLLIALILIVLILLLRFGQSLIERTTEKTEKGPFDPIIEDTIIPPPSE